VLAVIAAVASSELAAQDHQQQWKWCIGGSGISRDLGISGCTAVIQSGRETASNLATAFSNRGSAYGDKGQHDRAVQDFDQVIQLDPSNAGRRRAWRCSPPMC
jgi:tetratricopeptide (TPR) repeat protein